MADAIAKSPITGGAINKEVNINELQESMEALKNQVKEMHSRLLEAAILNNKYVQTIQEYQKQME